MVFGYIMFGVIAGLNAGLLFFGGLWWTVRRLSTCEHPIQLMVISSMARFLFVMAVFYSVMRLTDGLAYLALALAAFLGMRMKL